MAGVVEEVFGPVQEPNYLVLLPRDPAEVEEIPPKKEELGGGKGGGEGKEKDEEMSEGVEGEEGEKGRGGGEEGEDKTEREEGGEEEEGEVVDRSQLMLSKEEVPPGTSIYWVKEMAKPVIPSVRPEQVVPLFCSLVMSCLSCLVFLFLFLFLFLFFSGSF